jgi:hypothetical protein
MAASLCCRLARLERNTVSYPAPASMSHQFDHFLSVILLVLYFTVAYALPLLHSAKAGRLADRSRACHVSTPWNNYLSSYLIYVPAFLAAKVYPCLLLLVIL